MDYLNSKIRFIASIDDFNITYLNKRLKLLTVDEYQELNEKLYDADLIEEFERSFWYSIIIDNLGLLKYLKDSQIRELKSFIIKSKTQGNDDVKIIYDKKTKGIKIPRPIFNVLSIRYLINYGKSTNSLIADCQHNIPKFNLFFIYFVIFLTVSSFLTLMYETKKIIIVEGNNKISDKPTR